MSSAELDITSPYRTLPISYLVQTARDFDCSIFVFSVASWINVKDYEAIKKGFEPSEKGLLFYFNGNDVKEAERRIQCIFTP